MSIITYDSFQLWKMRFPIKTVFLKTINRSTWERISLRYCTTDWKVTGLISNGVTGIFHLHKPSGHTKTLQSTQPTTEMSTRNISCGDKGSQCIGMTTLPPACANCLEIWEPQSPATLRACLALYGDCFTFL
jgi:hypothetical protein